MGSSSDGSCQNFLFRSDLVSELQIVSSLNMLKERIVNLISQ